MTLKEFRKLTKDFSGSTRLVIASKGTEKYNWEEMEPGAWLYHGGRLYFNLTNMPFYEYDVSKVLDKS